MNSKGWLYLFFTDLFFDLLATANDWQVLRFVTKPMLIALLLVWFLFRSDGFSSIRYYMIFALLFSWMGDVILLLEEKSPSYFIAGLGSFLLAHIIYIFFFLRVRKTRAPDNPWNIFIVAPVGLYTVVFFFLLKPQLGNLKIPVLVYAIIISVMLICAIQTFSLKNKRIAYWWVMGAVLFVISDSLLAFNKFYHPFTLAGPATMFTYGLAQFAIVNGSLQYLAALKVSPAAA
jgi:uncharacterized membrane protein YhhN